MNLVIRFDDNKNIIEYFLLLLLLKLIESLIDLHDCSAKVNETIIKAINTQILYCKRKDTVVPVDCIFLNLKSLLDVKT